MWQNSKPLSSKSKIRYEKKCKKMDAFLAISKLNENDRIKKSVMTDVSVSTLENPESEPSPKRFCIESVLFDSKEFDLVAQDKKTMKPKAKLRLKEAGSAASLDVDREERIPLFFSDIQHLLLYSQLGPHSPHAPYRWCQLDKFHQLACTTVLVIENLSLYHYSCYESCFPYLRSKFCNKFELITPGAYNSDLVQDIATIPLTVPQTIKLMAEYGSSERAALQSQTAFDKIKGLFPVESQNDDDQLPLLMSHDKFPRTQLLLSGWQMVEENYPLPIKGLMETKYAGYVLTKNYYKDVTPFSPMFGVDCEMCLTMCDLELTRVSIVNESGKVIYDELVKPSSPIKNYLTEYSGVTAKMLKDVTKKLIEVQEDIRQILPADAILVGQSLGNDLHALKMMHPYVIDTSVIYNTSGDRKRKAKLQVLAQQFLNTNIQGNRKGHCPIEDSLASLNLTKLKLQNDISFGDVILGKIIKQVKNYLDLDNSKYVTSLLREITRMEKTALVVSLTDITTKYCHYTFKDNAEISKKICCISEESNELVVNKLCDLGNHYSFNIGHLHFTDSELENEPANLFRKIDHWIQKIDKSTGIPALRGVIFGGQNESGNGCCFLSIKKSS